MSCADALRYLASSYESCVDCKRCTQKCDMLGEAGFGMNRVARSVVEGTVDDDIKATILRCALCGLCTVGCPASVDGHDVMVSAREWLASDGVITTEGYESVLVDHDRTLFTFYRHAYGISYEDLVPETFDTVFFPGCILATYAPELTRAVYDWIAGQGISVALSEHCCGSPLISLGQADRAAKLREYMAERLRTLGVKRLVTVCPGCHAELVGDLSAAGIDVVPLPVLLGEAGVTIPGSGVITIHDSCRDRKGSFGPAVRRLFPGHELVEMEHYGENTMCCGSGGLVSAVDPDLYDARTFARLEEFRATGAEQMVTPCLTCNYAMAKQAYPGEVVNYLELLFGEKVDWDQVFANLNGLWEGECGLLAEEHFAEARCYTGWDASIGTPPLRAYGVKLK
ncbi:MAG: (Fe-S)-binding protein [Coriobacteriia bacterium]